MPKRRRVKSKPIANPPGDERFQFSLRHLQDGDPDFDYSGRASNYYEQLLSRLRDLCRENAQEVIASPAKRKQLRFHPINWEEARVSRDGFAELNEQLRELPAWQFQITSNAHGRIHGFIIDTIFYIVWLDPDHNLYPGR